MEETISQILSNLENPNSQITKPLLKDLNTLLNYTLRTNDPIDLDSLLSELSQRNISLTNLTTLVSNSFSSSNESDLSISILASQVYLSLILASLAGNEKNRSLLKNAMGFENDGGNWMNVILRRRCLDEKAAVRKAALLLLSKLTMLLGGELDGELLKTVGMACSDPLVSIRKVAISALSEVKFRIFKLVTAFYCLL